MLLKKLVLSGFKSFGKTTTFEFPSDVTAIVGPNGSGKSNVAEGIRWVLGEQSMKSLRGKRGEDLIFNGSDKASRLGKAEVKLVFDNSSKQFPYEFDEVVFGRRVLRDGTNEYLLNSSVVRLKDIFELLSRVGIGSTQHHIISQGEVDRILWATPAERQEMIEEALGLKEFHLKKKDASKKLTETENNVKQVEAQRREVTPHLTYLSQQAEKMKAFEEYRVDLNKKIKEYVDRETATINSLKGEHNKDKEPLAKTKKELEDAIAVLNKEIQTAEQEFSGVKAREDIHGKLSELEDRHKSLNRELGRIEGALTAETHNTSGSISLSVFMRELKEAVSFVDNLMQQESFEALKSGLKDVKVKLEGLGKLCAGDKTQGGGGDNPLGAKKQLLLTQLAQIERSLSVVQSEREEGGLMREDMLSDLREREQKLRSHEHELESVREQLREIEFSESKYKERDEELANFVKDLNIKHEPQKDANMFGTDKERQSLHRDIERLRIKLEEAGGIDGGVVDEYKETKKRDEFLSTELADLKKAEKSLADLMHELDEKLHKEFRLGLDNINKEFQKFFNDVFGGGKALLIYVEPVTNEEGEEEGGGVDIDLDIPKKRLKSLDMLSGGERALTSIALLFAMSAVHPPPFLVLDETDAALDEANSQRYADLLKDLSTKTQLVVITHNRTTMAEAGVLYGVTMSGEGISKLLSLKFGQAAEFAK
ncbi:MAG: AAA family ATPase [bacterium]|nr:AAA family ATPase [bacterium]